MAEQNNSELSRLRYPLAGTQLCPSRPPPQSRCIADSTRSRSSTSMSSLVHGDMYDIKEDDGASVGSSSSSSSTTSSRTDGDGHTSDTSSSAEGEAEEAADKIFSLIEQWQETQERTLLGQAERGHKMEHDGREMVEGAKQALVQCQQEKDLTTSGLKIYLGILVERLSTSEGKRTTLRRENRRLQAEVARLREELAVTSTTTIGTSALVASPVAEAATEAIPEATASMATPARGPVGLAASPAKESPTSPADVSLVETKSAPAGTNDKGYSPETLATFAKSKSLLAATLADMKSARRATGEKGYSPGTVACFAKTKSLLSDTFARMQSAKAAPVEKACEYSPDTKASFARTKSLLTAVVVANRKAKSAPAAPSPAAADTGITGIADCNSPPAATGSEIKSATTTTGTTGYTSPPTAAGSKTKSPMTTPTSIKGTKITSPSVATGRKTKSPMVTTGIKGTKSPSAPTATGSEIKSPISTTCTKASFPPTTTTSMGKAVSSAVAVTPRHTRRPLGNMNANSGGMRAAGAQMPSLAVRPTVAKPEGTHDPIDSEVPSLTLRVVTGTLAVENSQPVRKGPVRGGARTSRVADLHRSGAGEKAVAAKSGRGVRLAAAGTAGKKQKENEAGLSVVSDAVPAGGTASTRSTTRRSNQRTSISTTNGRGVNNRGKFMRF